MHPNLSPALHTDECNLMIRALQRCRETNPFGQYFNACSDLSHEVWKCLKKERLAKRQKNYDKRARANHVKKADVRMYDKNRFNDINEVNES